MEIYTFSFSHIKGKKRERELRIKLFKPLLNGLGLYIGPQGVLITKFGP